MKYGTFYLLPQNDQQKKTEQYMIELVCKLINSLWKQKKSILVACDNQLQAKQIDTTLWTFNHDTFIPHDLSSVNNPSRSPVIICWNCCYYNHTSRNLLINLMQIINLNFFLNFKEIIDFVPITDVLKKRARIRYQSYKKNGFQLNIINAPQLI